MVLDTEQHRAILLHVLAAARIPDHEYTVKVVAELKQAILDAKILEPKQSRRLSESELWERVKLPDTP